MTASPTDDLASAERRIEELTNELSLARGEVSQARGELAEAQEQQAATGGILRVISSSPADLQHVFSEIVASAVRHCDADNATVYQVDGDSLRRTAHHGSTRARQRGQVKLPLTRGSVAGRLKRGSTPRRETLHDALSFVAFWPSLSFVRARLLA
jgi:hypothetical protein